MALLIIFHTCLSKGTNYPKKMEHMKRQNFFDLVLKAFAHNLFSFVRVLASAETKDIDSQTEKLPPTLVSRSSTWKSSIRC